ncbi:MAG: glycosyltransferase family 2 protein [Candidatus Portnoybacteria bacterium CG_4_8_14_3_um_filter_44_15]|uniref:Glycosyltransferase family 2 protein n=4 Tax=Candidatus Portnoyibacteriota TaxID=1817913 RepID=A0A2M8KGR7_9BACT|nr:MAG: glycosyl transferase family 2 [Candidatus Portnoybacteria bacterium CG23_combo_of_CG06-09_8_20_14_all_44_36]PIW74643.1 MAG: glycosyltransferase family 2 protein [Candidatus Portnoybacteria bacterium CG_4_8_14_3_um_filter_44_15]PIZ69111.1 MAG: glycosyltransferase family 2 protein [Candidatus Portnoybacteria bacterium CG_4_10_14_0_2_um_filter_43_36]PJE59112.1 MAG: glycosyltransferase family 2 protein [Candidatus Portnoybacteria bacterium CG10_big_fil_rev_8_21_14_0_10_43_39]
MLNNENRRVSVIIPAYNEESKIGEVLDKLAAVIGQNGEIIVVDDGSSDRTAEIAKTSGACLIQNERNKGYGASLKEGIRQAQYDLIAITDADGTYPVERIPEFVNFIGDYDMVVGARNGGHVKIPLVRRPAKWILGQYANYLVRGKIPDLNSGLRVFKKDVFEKFQNFLPDGFSFTTTITLALLSNNYRVKYISIDYFEREGKSKIRPIRDTINFFSLITRTSLYFNPLRVFMPVSIFFLTAGFILLAYEVFIAKDITDKTMMLFLWGMQFGVIGLLADMLSKRK